jgi:hypothetical protein
MWNSHQRNFGQPAARRHRLAAGAESKEAAMSELTPEQHAAITDAVRAMRRSLDRQFPPRLAEHLTCAAVTVAFVAMCKSSTEIGKAALRDVINGATIKEAVARP